MNDRRQRRRSSDHAIEPQRLRNRPLLVRRALRLLRIVGFRLVVAFALNDPMLSFHLRDVQRRDVQTGLFLDARLNLAAGCLTLGFGDGELVRVDVYLEISSGFCWTNDMTVSTPLVQQNISTGCTRSGA